jgi:hypothetical protein
MVIRGARLVAGFQAAKMKTRGLPGRRRRAHGRIRCGRIGGGDIAGQRRALALRWKARAARHADKRQREDSGGAKGTGSARAELRPWSQRVQAHAFLSLSVQKRMFYSC